MTTSAFAKLFHSVCDDYAMSQEARAIAWQASLKANGSVKAHALRCYTILAATKPPFLPSAL